MFHLYQRLWPGYKSFSASSGLYGSSEPWVGGEPGDFRVTVLDFNRSMWLHLGNPWEMSLIVSGAGCTVLIFRGVELDNPIHLSSKVCWWMKQTENACGWHAECQGREEAYVKWVLFTVSLGRDPTWAQGRVANVSWIHRSLFCNLWKEEELRPWAFPL